MKNYISMLFESMKPINEEVPETVESPTSALEQILEELKALQETFQIKVMEPARDLMIQIEDEDAPESNQHLRALYRVEESMSDAVKMLETFSSDPIKEEDMNIDASVDSNLDLTMPSANSMEPSMDSVNLDSPDMTEETVHPEIIDGWEYLASDKEYDGNPTLLRQVDNQIVFIQKDTEPEAEIRYLAMTTQAGEDPEEYFSNSLEDLCKWLEMNELPVPTEHVKNAFSGVQEAEEKSSEYTEVMKDLNKKAPKEFKGVEEDLTISTLAEKPEDPEVAEIEEPEK